MKKEKRVLTENQVERRNSIKKTLKGLIAPLIFTAILAGAIYWIVTFQNKEEEPEVVRTYSYSGDENPIVLETDSLKFTMDPQTTVFTVEQKGTGKVWTSVAENAANDGTALAAEKNKLQSNLVLSYGIETGLETVFDSYSYSVLNGIYEIEASENEVKLFYSMGDVEKEFVIPPVITATEFDEWMAKMSKEAVNLIQQYYKKYDINKLGKKDDKEALLESYPIMETEVIYVLRDTTKENVRKQIQKYFDEAGYTYEMYMAHKELDNAEKVNEKPIFNVEMDFRLEGNDLVVEIPFSSIEYKSDFPVYTITPLPYFGAAGKDDEGYMLVPEGGGALINYNNGKTSLNNYYANVYGWDLDLTRDAVVHNTRAYYNVLGQATADSSYICILEDGASYASVTSDISGKTSTYNYVNAIYSICSREKYDVGQIANSDIYVYMSSLPDEKIVQRYRFVDSDSYVDMALAYRDYMLDTYGGYLALNTDTAAPLNVEVVGAVDKVKQILGVPTSRPLALTTYDEAADMIVDLKSSGVANLSVKLTGWMNGGVQQEMLNKAKPISTLGGKSDLQNLSNVAAQNDTKLYLNGITQTAHNSNLLDGFFSYTDAAKLLTRERTELYNYSHITYAAREEYKPYYLLHTDLALKMADNLQAAAKKYNAGVSFEDNGMDLASDFYSKDYNSRESVRLDQMAQFKRMDDEGTNLMVNMGNDYAVAYVDMVTNMDLKGSEYTILDQEVPFYQIALHGYVNYVGEPINTCGDESEEILNSVEYGAGLNYSVMDESSFALQKTLYTEYYGSEYSSVKNRMLETYTRYNNELGHTFNQTIANHEVLSAGFTCTTYEDGTKVYVNYSYAETMTAPDGTVVAARDYAVVR